MSDYKPRLKLVARDTWLRCRPAELYLGAATSRGQLDLYVFYDSHVYAKDVVDEWLAELREATIWYLGGDLEQRHTAKL